MRINKELKSIIGFMLVSNWAMAGNLTMLYMEDFEDFENNPTFDLNLQNLNSTSTGYNRWIVNGEYDGGTGTFNCDSPFLFNYTVGDFPMQPGGIPNGPFSNYLHTIRLDALGDDVLSASYFAATDPDNGICGNRPDERYFAAMNMDVSTEGLSNVTLSFWWLNEGGFSPPPLNLNTAFGQIFYSTDSGNRWTLIDIPIEQYHGQDIWTQQTVSLPEWRDLPRLRFGIRFTNTVAGVASDKGFGFDEMSITAEPIPDLIFADSFDMATPQ